MAYIKTFIGNVRGPKGEDGISVETAEVGQTIVVKAVDENGKPTEWEAVDMPEGETDYTKLENKPTETIGGDTLTWDGNTDGLTVYDGTFYKVSDAVPTKEDFKDGFTEIILGRPNSFDSRRVFEEDGMLIADCVVIIQDSDVNERGTYFDVDTTSLTIPGYTGFGKEVLKPDSLPQHTHKWSDIEDPVCGESFGDTLTWDGNREGRTESLSVAWYPSYKCSDAVVTLEDIANGLSYTLSDGRTRTLEPNAMSTWIVLDSFIHEHFAVVNNEYAAELGYEPGIFLTGYEDAEEKYIYVKSITIPGYTGFPVVKKLDAKYLPEDHINALIDAKLGVIENGTY